MLAVCLLAAGCERGDRKPPIEERPQRDAAADAQGKSAVDTASDAKRQRRREEAVERGIVPADPSWPAGAADTRHHTPPPAPKVRSEDVAGGPRVVEFAPGLRIDYAKMQVELDCEVILREAELELLVYAKAPTPKEHETILKTQVQPERIFEALGLLGITPGHPTLYDWETQEITPPKGDPVDIFVRYDREGAAVEHSICDWVLNLRTQQPMVHSPWLFTGGERDDRGRYAADIEGTVVTVVDFPSAVLSVPASHTSADEHLWAAANTPAIPEKGTKVIVLFRPVKQSR